MKQKCKDPWLMQQYIGKKKNEHYWHKTSKQENIPKQEIKRWVP